MNINPAWRNQPAAGVNFSFSRFSDRPDFGDATITDCDIGSKAFLTGTINDSTVPDYEIIHG